MKKKFRLTYNSPVILTFSIACFLIFIADKYIAGGKIISVLFTVPGNSKAEITFNWANGIDYIRLFTHVFGHADWNSLLGNLAFILLLGPLMEERYGSLPVLLICRSSYPRFRLFASHLAKIFPFSIISVIMANSSRPFSSFFRAKSGNFPVSKRSNCRI